jgi:hypothetical protein
VYVYTVFLKKRIQSYSTIYRSLILDVRENPNLRNSSVHALMLVAIALSAYCQTGQKATYTAAHRGPALFSSANGQTGKNYVRSENRHQQFVLAPSASCISICNLFLVHLCRQSTYSLFSTFERDDNFFDRASIFEC